MAMVARGPRPGRTPIIVPTNAPRNAYTRFIGIGIVRPNRARGSRASTAPKPMPRFANKVSMMSPSVADEGWPEWKLQLQPPDKYHQAYQDQYRRINQRGLPGKFVTGVAGNSDQDEQRNDQAERLKQQTEQRNRAEDQQQGGPIELVNFFCGGLGGQAAHQDDH